jgi:hypothetical protein
MAHIQFWDEAVLTKDCPGSESDAARGHPLGSYNTVSTGVLLDPADSVVNLHHGTIRSPRPAVVNWLTGLSTPSLLPLLSVEVTV